MGEEQLWEDLGLSWPGDALVVPGMLPQPGSLAGAAVCSLLGPHQEIRASGENSKALSLPLASPGISAAAEGAVGSPLGSAPEQISEQTQGKGTEGGAASRVSPGPSGCCVLCLKFPEIPQGIRDPKRVVWGRALALEHSCPFPACPCPQTQ